MTSGNDVRIYCQKRGDENEEDEDEEHEEEEEDENRRRRKKRMGSSLQSSSRIGVGSSKIQQYRLKIR